MNNPLAFGSFRPIAFGLGKRVSHYPKLRDPQVFLIR